MALGNFDGLHLGHRQVVQPILNQRAITQSLIRPPGRMTEEYGRVNERPAWEKSERVYSTVVTFDPHPQEFFTGQAKHLLTPPGEKVPLLQAMGVEQLVLLPFDRELAQLSPQKFVEKILIEQLKARHISVGWDFRFGQGRMGHAEDLRAIAGSYGVDVTIVPLFTHHGERISSSVIRQALDEGNIQQVNRLLGRSYHLTGSVVEGQKLGRTLGFPTANLLLPPDKFLPRFGVYAVQVQILSDKIELFPASRGVKGVMNIGCRPTVGGIHPAVEVHLFDWEGDLYGQTLVVYLEQFLRPERKFPSLDALKQQIQEDCQIAKQILIDLWQN